MQADVGIVTRTRDRPLFLARAVGTVLAQHHADWRLVIVNDGGDPARVQATLAAVGADARISVIDNPVNRGRAAAFNQGLAALDTRFVCCLDDDDSWEPDFLSSLLAFHAENAPLVPDLGGVAAQVTALREELVTEPDGTHRIEPMGEDGLPNAFFRKDFLIGPITYATYRQDIYPVQWMLERAAVAALGGFPEGFEVMEDRAFVLRFLQHRRIALLDRPLAYHHRRVSRANDGGQAAELNTLDNPSYDWRRFSDLALPTLTTPADAPDALLAGLIRAAAATVLKEMNDETSALWHKINGEALVLQRAIEGAAGSLQDSIRSVEGWLGPRQTPAPTTPADAGWSLWGAVGPGEIGYALGIGVPFLGRLSLSHKGAGDGLLFHADPERRAAILQIPHTGDWCALEVDLAGLAAPDGALWAELGAWLTGGGLIQTAVVRNLSRGKGVEVVEPHVHAVHGARGIALRRHLAPELIDPTRKPRLSIILPRQATNLRLHLHELAVVPV